MARQDKKLVAEAKALGIDVDGRWGDETIQERIDVVKANQVTEGQGDGSTNETAGGDGDAGTSEAGEAGPLAVDGAGAPAADAPDQPGSGPSDPGEAPPAPESDPADAAGDLAHPDDREPDADVGDPQDAAGGSGAAEVVSDGETGGSTSTEAEPAPAGDDGVAAGADVGSPASDGSDQGAAAAVAPDGVSVAPDGGDAGSNPPDAADDAGEPADPDGDPAPEGLAVADAGDGYPADGTGDPAGEGEEGDPVDGGSAEAVQHAMTKPILAAFQAACSVQGVLNGESTDRFSIDTSWMPGEEFEDKIINLVRHAAPFVRQWPNAPVDALYGHVASNGGVNLVLDVLWSELGFADRQAWWTFRETLATIDRTQAAEESLAKLAAEAREIRRVPIDETTLEEIEGSFERTEVAGGPR